MLPDRSILEGGSRWMAGILAATLMHATVVAAVLVNVSWQEPTPPPAAMVIEVAMLPSAPIVPTSDIPPGPQQEEARKEQPKEAQKIPPFDPPPKIKTATPPEVAIQKQEIPEPEKMVEEQKTVETTTAPPASEAPVEDIAKAPTTGATSATASAEQSWETKLISQLERNKRYPRKARWSKQEDVVYVRFVMNRKGAVLSSAIDRSQGYELLDSEVLELLQRAQPLPEPPSEVAGEQIEMVVPVEFFLTRS